MRLPNLFADTKKKRKTAPKEWLVTFYQGDGITPASTGRFKTKAEAQSAVDFEGGKKLRPSN